jgi:ABC-2 type transport system ATP-binding protein/lipopolysaccharide transport system ATP-binding protein
MLFGMTRAEIEKKVPEIEEFSELGEYFALPMRSYSLGMATRLGFAVATAIDPGILLMDEGIGAGDARFAERAARRMERFIDKSRILVLASHSEALIRSTCNKAAFMKAGRVLAVGGIDEIFKQYHDSIK